MIYHFKENEVKKEQKIKLLKALPKPEELVGLMPAMNQKRMLIELLTEKNISSTVADMTLLALLIATVKLIMKANPNWEEYLDTDHVADEEELPEPCGDPECEGCKQLEAAMKHAEKHGGTIKAVRLSKKQAMEMGLIDEDGNDIKQGIGHCQDDDEDSTGKVVH